MTKTHGGRRHGLSPAGASPSTKFRLGAVADARLREIAAASGFSLSEIVRRLVMAPNAIDNLRRDRQNGYDAPETQQNASGSMKG